MMNFFVSQWPLRLACIMAFIANLGFASHAHDEFSVFMFLAVAAFQIVLLCHSERRHRVRITPYAMAYYTTDQVVIFNRQGDPLKLLNQDLDSRVAMQLTEKAQEFAHVEWPHYQRITRERMQALLRQRAFELRATVEKE